MKKFAKILGSLSIIIAIALSLVAVIMGLEKDATGIAISGFSFMVLGISPFVITKINNN